MMGERKRKAVRVTYPVFDDTLPVYANQATVQFTGTEFVIGFYAAFPPILVGTEEEVQAKADALDEVPAKCVAKIVIAKDRMAEIVNVLGENVARVKPSEEAEPSAEGENNG